MSKEQTSTLKVSATIEDGDDKDLRITNPIKLDLGDQAYKVVRKNMADTEKKLESLGLSYYTIRGGEVVSKQYNNDDKTAVVFNKGLPDEFEIPTDSKRRSYDVLETWHPDKKQALGIAKELTLVELEKSNETLDKWKEAQAFLQDQLDRNLF